MKSLVLILTFTAVVSCYGFSSDRSSSQLDWKTLAWTWLCRESGGTATTNQQIADTLARDLAMSYSQTGFSVLVGDAGSDIGSRIKPTIDYIEGTLCSKSMIAVKIDNNQFQCNADTALDETQLNEYLSASLASNTTINEILDTVLSMEVLGFDFEVVLASTDKTTAGLAQSTPDDCSGKFEGSNPLVGYFGLTSTDSDPDDFGSLAIKTLINEITADSAISNEDLAKKVIDALKGRPNNDFDWVTAVFPYADYDNATFYKFFHSSSTNDWDTNMVYVKNIVGKNLLVSGIAGIQDQFNKCTRSVDPAIFEPMVKGAISDNPDDSSMILQSIQDGARLLGFEAEVILVATGVEDFAYEPFTYVDCTFRYTDGSSDPAAWVFFYGLPIV